MFHVPERYRITGGKLGSNASYGNNGAFRIPLGTKVLSVIASDGEGWEHVSVSTPDRTPTWSEMCAIVTLFWDPEDAVMQLHPPASTYVNNHAHCLHLWRPTDITIPLPPSILVGDVRRGTIYGVNR